MKLIFVAALMLVACAMADSHALPFKSIPWLRELTEENARTHCFDEYLKASKKLQFELLRSMNKCGTDNRKGREIIRCINQLIQGAALEMQQAESLICAETNEEKPSKKEETHQEAPVEENQAAAPVEESSQ